MIQTLIEHIFSYDNIIYSLLGLLGVLLHYLKLWKNAKDEGKKFLFKKHYPNAFLSILTTLISIFLRDDIADLWVITKFSAIVLGFMGNMMFFGFIDTKAKKTTLE